MRQQAKQYYYIDRKLVSSDKSEVAEGIRDLELFLPHLTTTDILNSIAMRLMDLYWTSKVSYIKVAAASLLAKLKHELVRLPSKDQVVSILHKCLKSPDLFFRVLTIGTIQQISCLFLRENSVYHLLLSRLRQDEQATLQETCATVSCLSTLLAQSEHLSKLFSNNICQLADYGQIQIPQIMYLSIYAKFESQSYPKVLNDLWILYQRRPTPKIKHYFSRFLRKSATLNFVCYVACERLFQSLNKKTNPVISCFHFHFIQPHQNVVQLSDPQLLDFAYMATKSQLQELLSSGQQQMCSRIQTGLKASSISFELLLMSFYCSQNYDQHFTQILKSQSSLKWIKAALVTANFQLALTLINNSFNITLSHHSSLIFMASYALLHCNPSEQNLLSFLQTMKNLAKTSNNSKQVLQLCKAWGKVYVLGEGDEMTDEAEDEKGQEFLEQYKYLQSGEGTTPPRMKNMQYSKIYLSKQGVQAIFKMLQ